MSYDNSNRIALWKNNDRKEVTHPHLTGQGERAGEVYASAWFSKDISDEDKKLLGAILSRYDSKKPFINISLKPKESSQPTRQQEPSQPDFDDDIPF